MKNKRGLSPVIAVIMLVGLAVGLVAVIWVVVDNFVVGRLNISGSCFGILEQVNFNDDFTCYNSGSNRVQFSINIDNIDIDEALIGITGENDSMTFELDNTPKQVNHLVFYPSAETDVFLPEKNSGLTYSFDLTAAGFIGVPKSIEIAPGVSGTQCQTSDMVAQLDDCGVLIN